MKRYTLWGTAKDAEDWNESILLSDASAADVAKIKPMAKRDGFRNLRAVLIDNAAPDFAGTVSAGSSHPNPRASEVTAGVGLAKAAILKDATEHGWRLPPTFSELHDLCDANEYLVIAQGFTGFDDPKLAGFDVTSDESTAFANAVSDELNTWLATRPQTPPRKETVSQAFHGSEFRKKGMGGNTTAWILKTGRDRKAFQQWAVTDGDYRHPVKWTEPAVVTISNEDEQGPYASYQRRFASVREFFTWFDHIDGGSPDKSSDGFSDADVDANGFASID